MTREENYKRGTAAEVRIMKKLQSVAEVEPSRKRYPDLVMKLNGSTYAIECKTVLTIHQGSPPRMGCAKISSLEMEGMNQLYEEGMIPCLIVEFRPSSGPQETRPCLIVDWKDVIQKFSEGHPDLLTLRFPWLLEKGQNLNLWLQQKSMEEIEA